ncbi:MAG: hypothetical protein DMG01_15210, partial [Acidobacteria bacterium]
MPEDSGFWSAFGHRDRRLSEGAATGALRLDDHADFERHRPSRQRLGADHCATDRTVWHSAPLRHARLLYDDARDAGAGRCRDGHRRPCDHDIPIRNGEWNRHHHGDFRRRERERQQRAENRDRHGGCWSRRPGSEPDHRAVDRWRLDDHRERVRHQRQRADRRSRLVLDDGGIARHARRDDGSEWCGHDGAENRQSGHRHRERRRSGRFDQWWRFGRRWYHDAHNACAEHVGPGFGHDHDQRGGRADIGDHAAHYSADRRTAGDVHVRRHRRGDQRQRDSRSDGELGRRRNTGSWRRRRHRHRFTRLSCARRVHNHRDGHGQFGEHGRRLDRRDRQSDDAGDHDWAADHAAGRGASSLPATFTVVVGTLPAGDAVRNVHIDWGDGSGLDLGAISGSTTVSHVYTASGSYSVTAKITDTGGNTQTVATSVTVVATASPTIIITPSVATATKTATFTIQVTPPTGVGITDSLLTFGDGNQQKLGGLSGTTTVTHVYS